MNSPLLRYFPGYGTPYGHVLFTSQGGSGWEGGPRMLSSMFAACLPRTRGILFRRLACFNILLGLWCQYTLSRTRIGAFCRRRYPAEANNTLRCLRDIQSGLRAVPEQYENEGLFGGHQVKTDPGTIRGKLSPRTHGERRHHEPRESNEPGGPETPLRCRLAVCATTRCQRIPMRGVAIKRQIAHDNREHMREDLLIAWQSSVVFKMS